MWAIDLDSHYICVPLYSQGGASPLFMAAQNGHLDVVEKLIAKGAKVDLAKDVSLNMYVANCVISGQTYFLSSFLHM